MMKYGHRSPSALAQYQRTLASAKSPSAMLLVVSVINAIATIPRARVSCAIGGSIGVLRHSHGSYLLASGMELTVTSERAGTLANHSAAGKLM
jgi:hypothetical protein